MSQLVNSQPFSYAAAQDTTVDPALDWALIFTDGRWTQTSLTANSWTVQATAGAYAGWSFTFTTTTNFAAPSTPGGAPIGYAATVQGFAPGAPNAVFTLSGLNYDMSMLMAHPDLLYDGLASFTGSAGADLFQGSTQVYTAAGAVFDGGAGDDTLAVGPKPATVHGGDGDDTLIIQGGAAGTLSGATYAYGDAGNDLIVAQPHANLVAAGGDGDDQLIYVTPATEGSPSEGIIHVEFDGGAGNDSVSLTTRFSSSYPEVSTIYLDGAPQAGKSGFWLSNIESLTVIDPGALQWVPLVIYGGAHADVITLVSSGMGYTVLGGDGDDMVMGSAARDVLEGGRGDDVLNGGGGDLNIASYEHADAAVQVDLRISGVAQQTGGAGADTLTNFQGITGSRFGDVLIGGDGVDTISGGAGDDIIIGGRGAGTAQPPYFNAGGDVLSGGDGADIYRYFSTAESTAADPDRITDFLHGVDHIDLTAVAGTVAIVHKTSNGSLGSTVMFGGDGLGNYAGQIWVDNVWLSSDDLMVNEASGPAAVYLGSPPYGSVYNVSQGRNYPNRSGEEYYGGAAQDLVYGASSVGRLGDTLINIIAGGASGDLLHSGASSNNTFLLNSAESSAADPDTIFEFQTALDRIQIGTSSYQIVALDNGDSLLQFDADGAGGYRGAVLVKGVTLTAANIITSVTVGGVVSPWITYRPAYVLGSYGEDTIYANKGLGDFLQGGPGGRNTFLMQQVTDSTATARDEILDFRPGFDRLDLSRVAGGLVRVVAQDNGDSVIQYGANAAGILQGEILVRRATPQGGDVIVGAHTQLVMQGSNLGDHLIGGPSSDLIYGGAGDDLLQGGMGSDTLVGGAGADIFKIGSPNDGVDSVLDFRSGADHIALDAAAFGVAAGSLAQAGVSFVTGESANHAGKTLLYNPTTGVLSWVADGAGVGVALAVVGPAGIGVSSRLTLPFRNSGQGNPTTHDASWTLLGGGDFDGDGTSDLLFTKAGATDVWAIQNGQWGGTLSPGAHSWTATSLADFNNDGHTDILWRNAVTGQSDVWLLRNGSWIGGFTPVDPGGSWVAAGAADFNADGYADILWRNTASGTMLGQLYHSGVQIGTFDPGQARGTDWTLAAVADFNNDGHADLLWKNDGMGRAELSLYKSTGYDVTIRVEGVGSVAGVGDLDGNGFADILFKNADGSLAPYLINDGSWLRVGATLSSHGAGWSVATVADYTGDGVADILWRNDATGQLDLWRIKEGGWQASVDPSVHSANWALVGGGDVNSDGFDDLVWLDKTSGQIEGWEMRSGERVSSFVVGSHAGWTVAGVADFNADGDTDILWQNPTTGALDGWLLRDIYYTANFNPGGPGAAWTLEGVGDFNADGAADLLYRDRATGQTQAWLVKNGQAAGAFILGSHNTDYGVQAVGDFNGDGSSDVFWRDPATGEVDVWLLKDGVWAGSVQPGFYNNQWTFAGVGDFNGDGTQDVLWRNAQTGQNDIWLLHNGGWMASIDPGAMAAGWTVAGVRDLNHDGVSDIVWQQIATGQVQEWVVTAHGANLTVDDLGFV